MALNIYNQYILLYNVSLTEIEIERTLILVYSIIYFELEHTYI